MATLSSYQVPLDVMRSLRSKCEFRKAYEEGVKRVGRYLVLYLLPAEDDAIAVVASRKVGGAVERNRAKRLLREALRSPEIQDPDGRARIFRLIHPAGDRKGKGKDKDKDEIPGLWIVAIARHEILSAKSADVRDELLNLLP
jgi:ribonuclease P protein component